MSARTPKSKRWALRKPWDEAVDLFGESTLKGLGSAQRVANWRRLGVPADVWGPLMEQKVRAGTPEVLQDMFGKLRQFLDVPAEVLDMEGRVRDLHRRTEGKGSEWSALKSLLDALLRNKES